MTKRAIFQTPPTKNLINVGLLVVRLGMGAGFLWVKNVDLYWKQIAKK